MNYGARAIGGRAGQSGVRARFECMTMKPSRDAAKAMSSTGEGKS